MVHVRNVSEGATELEITTLITSLTCPVTGVLLLKGHNQARRPAFRGPILLSAVQALVEMSTPEVAAALVARYPTLPFRSTTLRLQLSNYARLRHEGVRVSRYHAAISSPCCAVCQPWMCRAVPYSHHQRAACRAPHHARRAASPLFPAGHWYALLCPPLTWSQMHAVEKIVTFLKNGLFQALIQMSTVEQGIRRVPSNIAMSLTVEQH